MYAPQARPGALDSARRSSGDAVKLKQVRSWGSSLLAFVDSCRAHAVLCGYRSMHLQHDALIWERDAAVLFPAASCSVLRCLMSATLPGR